MNETIRVVSTSHGTDEWRAERADGSYLCDVRLELSARRYGSRYYVLRNGRLDDEGTFTFDVWDHDAMRDVLTAVMKARYSGATVTVDLQPQRRAMGV